MKISEYGSVMSAYLKSSYEPVKAKRSSAAAKNTDKAEFSSASRENAVAGAKASARNTVESFASPKRIAALKAMIKDGSYNISAESVAASILEG